MKKLISLSNPKFFVLLISIVLFVLPFFWIKPSELELGGDSSRLYLYDPWTYLKVDGLYSVQPEGMGDIRPDQFILPFVLVLGVIYTITHSPYFLICVLNSIKLVGAFLFMYLIVVEILKNYAEKNKQYLVEIAGILAAIFYTFSPCVGKPIQTALLIHNQVFLNPMIFYLMLRFLLTDKVKYLWFTLLTTLIFSPNFSLKAPTAPFSFYPLAFLFLGLYVVFCIKKSLPWKKLFIGLLFFLGLHMFDIVPVLVYTLDPGSSYNLRLFDAKSVQNEGLNYFDAILSNAMVTKSLFYTYGVPLGQWTVFIAPLSIILGFLLSHKRQKDFTLIAIFFFVTIFLESANITHIGVAIYRMLFYIPGFSMFRNFYGQWQWVQTFFYSLFFGYALFLIFSKLKKRIVYVTSIITVGIFIYASWPFIGGQILRQPHRATQNVSTIIEMDPHYQQTLTYFKNVPGEGKIFDFPFTEFSYQVIPGLNNGAYIGPSPTSYLTGRRDFAGYQILTPFSDTFLKLIEEKKYSAIKRLFGLLNVKYVLYDTNPKAYKQSFSGIPYTLFLKILPDSNSLTKLVENMVDGKSFQSENYLVYFSDKNYYLPHFYIPTTTIAYRNTNISEENTSFFVDNMQKDPRIMFMNKDSCENLNASLCQQNKFVTPEIIYKRINPTMYKIVISDAQSPFFLVFSDKFHRDWKAFIIPGQPEKLKPQGSYFSGSILEANHEDTFLNAKIFETLSLNSIPEKQHISVNGYANGWYVTPQDSNGKKSYEIIVEMTQQRTFYYGLAISFISLFIFLLYGAKILHDNKFFNIPINT